MATTRTSGAPRWPVLLALGALVLAAHLWLITGAGWPTGSSDAEAGTETVAKAPEASPVPQEAGPAAATRVPAMEISQVRWVPASPATTAPPPPPPVATPRPGRVTDPSPPRPADPTTTTGTDSAPSAPVEATAAVQTPEPPAQGPSDVPTGITDTAEPPPGPPTPAEQVAAAPTPSARAGDPAPPPARAAAAPSPSATLRYDIRGRAKGLSYSADAELRWRNEGDRYNARMEISAFLMGSRVQTSVGQLGAEGLAPERFGDRRRSTEKATHFDPAGQRIRFSSNAPDAPWQPGAQDRLSLFLQLGALLQARPDAYPAGSRIELLVAGTGGAEVWRFELGPAESLNLPAGTVSARRLLRGPLHEHDSTVEIWLAPAHHHLPVRIRITEPDGSQADQQLRQLPQPTPP